MQLLEFTPLYIERIWGGRNLESKLGRNLPDGKVIGESWEIVDRADQQSVVSNGPLAGKTLRELMERFAVQILGPNSDPDKPFPILVKWLDCHKSLSLQVHPPTELAAALKGEPKTENWYIADTEEGASIIAGLVPGVTRERFEQALAKGNIKDSVQLHPTATGDSMLVESGCVHAINAGNLILEIQQNSDTTYRVHDWNRVGQDGVPRQLHINEALQSINFNLPQKKLLSPQPGRQVQVLADCDEFRIRKFTLASDNAPVSFPTNEQPRLFHILSGELYDTISGQILQSSKNYLQPYVTGPSLVAKTEAALLVTDQFYT